MANVVEEKLREAACTGDLESIQTLLISYNVNINSQNSINGWTALHWACKRGYTDVVRFLLNHGSDPNIENSKGEKAIDVCDNTEIKHLLGETSAHTNQDQQMGDAGPKFSLNYLKTSQLNGHMDIPKLRTRPADLSSLPKTALPTQSDDLVLKVRVAGSHDPDFIEIEVTRWNLTYSSLLTICCDELDIKAPQVERIRKLPDTRLRNDGDIKRLTNLQRLEIVLKPQINCEKLSNCYQSISACKDQTILY